MLTQQWIKLCDQTLLQILIFDQLRDGERAIPTAGFRINYGFSFAFFDFEFARYEVLRDPFADLLRRSPGGPVLKVRLRRDGNGCRENCG
jgi:hypothetical protein